MTVDNDLSKLRIDKVRISQRQGKKKRYSLLLVALLLIFLLVILYFKGVLKPALEVQVVTVQRIYPAQTFTLLNASGYVVAQRKAAVASKITGRLVFLAVEEGSRVKKDEVIARLVDVETCNLDIRSGTSHGGCQGCRFQHRPEPGRTG